MPKFIVKDINMKCALITGGSRGIGRAICIKMAVMGYYVLINYKNNAAEANKTLAVIRQSGGQGELLAFDVSSKETGIRCSARLGPVVISSGHHKTERPSRT